MSRRALPAAARSAVEPFDYGPAATTLPSGLVAAAGGPRPAQLVQRQSSPRTPEGPATASLPTHPGERTAAERAAFADGYAQGERAGIAAAGCQLDAQRARLAQTLDDLIVLRDRLTQRTERQVVELALAVAGRILRREVSLDRELLLVMARLALDRLGDAPSGIVRLHPDDEIAVRNGRTSWPTGAIEIVADPSVKPGGCIVQTDVGHVDLGIDTQLGELSTALLGEHRSIGSTGTS